MTGALLAFTFDKMLGRQEVVVRHVADPLGHAPASYRDHVDVEPGGSG